MGLAHRAKGDRDHIVQRIDPELTHYVARARAMKSRLFTPQRLEALLDAHEIPMVVDVLLNSPYAREMAEALAREKGAEAIEEAVSRNLVSTLQWLRAKAPEAYRAQVDAFLLAWDLAAVKSLIRCRHRGVEGPAAWAALHPGPTLTVAMLENLIRRGSMEDLVAGLVAWNPTLCLPLMRWLGRYQAERDCVPLEEALDRTYFVEHVKNLGALDDENAQAVRLALQIEIDRINLRGLFSFRRAGLSPEAQLDRALPEGLLSFRRLRAIAEAPSEVEAMEEVGRTPYGELVERFYEFVATGRFGPMERLFDLIAMKHLRRSARSRAMTLASVVYYVWAKANEVMNLRLVARGHARHLPRGRVREEMILI